MTKELNSQRIALGHQHGRYFIVLGHKYGRRHLKTLYSSTEIAGNVGIMASTPRNVCKKVRRNYMWLYAKGKEITIRLTAVSTTPPFTHTSIVSFSRERIKQYTFQNIRM